MQCSAAKTTVTTTRTQITSTKMKGKTKCDNKSEVRLRFLGFFFYTCLKREMCGKVQSLGFFSANFLSRNVIYSDL